MSPRDAFRDAEARAFAAAGARVRTRVLALPTLGVQVALHEAGPRDAPALVLLGGNGVAAAWAPLVARLQDRYRVLAVDRPGLGASTMLDYSGIDVRAYATRFLDALLDALALPRASLVANSMGGYWALCFALRRPERVERLALLGEPAGSARVPSLRHRLLGTPPFGRILYATALKPGTRATERTLRLLLAHPERVPVELRDAMTLAAKLPGATRSWLSLVPRLTSLRGPHCATFALRDELPKLDAPTLLVWGERDPFGGPDLGVEMARLMPHARVERLPDAGHLPWLDEPDRVARSVDAFLAGAR